MKITNTIRVLPLIAAITGINFEVQAEVDVSDYGNWQDILTPEQARGRFDWLERCYSGVLVEVWEKMYDVTDLKSKEQKISEIKQMWLTENGEQKLKPQYLTFADINHQNPKNWFGGVNLNDTCASIPTDYQVSGLITSFNFQQYCNVESEDTKYASISQVKINDMINDSAASAYSNYWGKVAVVKRNKMVSITLTPENPYDLDLLWNGWIDWNQDGDFNDADEYIIEKMDSTGIVDVEISVPASAVPGLTKFRVNTDWVGTAKPCIEVQLGEVEDYTIKVY